MTIEYPTGEKLPQLRALWQQAFGDTEEYLDSFFETAFSCDRCRCVLEYGQILAAAYFLDCSCQGEKFAYLYAVAVEEAHRRKGLGKQLLADIGELLQKQEYAGLLLVPQDGELRKMYKELGFQDFGGMEEIPAAAGDAMPLEEITPAAFGELRRSFLPEGAVQQEGPGLQFLARQVRFYKAPGVLLAAHREKENLFAPEYLGDTSLLSRILASLDARDGTFRIPGKTPFAMYKPLTPNCPRPQYFAFAFD